MADDPSVKTGAEVANAAEAARPSGGGDVGDKVGTVVGAARTGSKLDAGMAATGIAGSAAGLAGGLAGGAAANVTSKVGDMTAVAGKALAVGAMAKAFADARRAAPASVATSSVPTSAPVPAPAAPAPPGTRGADMPAPSGGGSPVAKEVPARLPEPPDVPIPKDANAPLFTITCKAIPSSARIVSLRGNEAMSRPYAFEVHLQMEKPLSATPYLEMKEVVNQRTTLTFFDLEERERGQIHGQIAVIELLEGLQDDLLYRAVLVPKLASLGQNRRSRVYVGKGFLEILHEVLDKLNGWKEGEDYELALHAKYPALDHVCQYKESDLRFLTRLMEREGVYYFFEQGKEREKVVITDHMKRHTTLARRKDGKPGPAPKLYSPRSPTDRNLEESFWSFREKHVGGAGVAVRGYDYLNPHSPVESDSAGEEGPTLSFPDENVKTSEQAARLATVRKEEVEARRVQYRGEGPVYGLRPGYFITVIGFPGDSRKAEVLVTEVTHHGLLGGDARTGYRAEVAGIPADVQYRPERRTPRPRIEGVERAIVDGPYNEEYAQIDEHGRYLVKIDFDESGLKDGRASMWVRMLQPHGGSREGFHFPLRKGTEVMLVFLGGDPDRPVIAGVAPNACTASPVTRPSSTQNVIQTGGLSRIEIEDTKDNEYVRISTPGQDTLLHMGELRKSDGPPPEDAEREVHNFALSTKGNGLIHTGKELDVTVDGFHMENVKGNVLQIYEAGVDQRVTKGDAKHKIETGEFSLFANAGIRLETAGMCQIMAPAGIETHAPKSHSDFTGYKFDMVGAKMSMYGTVAEVVGALKFQQAVNQVAISAMKIDFTGARFQNTPSTDIKSTGQAIEIGFANLCTFGIISFL